LNTQTGTVLRVYNKLYIVAFSGQETPVICQKRKTANTVFPGDHVSVEIDEHQAQIVQVLPRTNLIPHPRVANVARILYMVAAKQPQPDVWVVDQFLHYWQINNVPVTMFVNKTDLMDKETADLFVKYEMLGNQIIYMEALKLTGGEKTGLLEVIRGQTVMLAGQSGVGKSTLLKALIPESDALTGTVSKKNQRGRQTTKQTSLHYCSQVDSRIVDTPGFSMVESKIFTLASTQKYYQDVLKLGVQCRFPNCRHIHEPDCAVKQSLERSEIYPFRYQNYLKTLALLEKNPKW
jgi:ribosome biogenesis GTPase